MYENFYEPYVSIENNVKEAANNAASHSVSSNICTELETIVNDLEHGFEKMLVQIHYSNKPTNVFSYCLICNK